MASTLTKRDITTIFLLVLSISGAVSGLPLTGIDGENTDGQVAQPSGQQMFPADMPPPRQGAFNNPGTGVLPPNKLPEPRSDGVVPQINNDHNVDSPVEAAEVAGTGLAMMAGPVVPESNTGDMFPNNMPPPPPGAMNDAIPDQGQDVPTNNGDMFPDNMPPPPPGAMNDAVPDQGSVVPANNGDMFPDNMPPPPPGAMNDDIPEQGPVIPANNGDMFPDNMVPPPPGAMNDAVPDQGPVVPAKNVDMFPDNMPPPPSGAFNDGDASLPEQEIAPREDEANQDNLALPNKETVPPYRGMFPPNMPPPPPGAFNDPPPVPKLSEKKFNEPAFPSDGTAVEPVYVTGMNVPDAAVVPSGEQSPFIDPNQESPFPSNQQYEATANEPSNTPPYNPDNAVSNDQNSQTAGDPHALSPNTQNNPGEGQAPYNPDDLDASNSPSPSESNNPVNQKFPVFNPSLPTQQLSSQEIPTYYVAAETSGHENVDGNPSEIPSETTYESPDEGQQSNVNENSQEWSPESPEAFSERETSESLLEESESDSDDYSFMDFLESIMDSNSYESSESFTDDGGAFGSTWEDSESEYSADVDSSYLQDSSEPSDLDWIFNGASAMGSEGGSSEGEEEGYFGGDGADETESHGEDQKQTFPDTYIDALEREDELYQTGGTKLIIYCIPALILSVLILLAWKNYRGKIRVVGVPTGDAKHHDWKSNKSSEEHAPMLINEDQEEREY